MDSIRQKRLSRLLVASKVLLLALGCFMASSSLVMDDDVVIVGDYVQASLLNWSKAMAIVNVKFYQVYQGVVGCLVDSFQYTIAPETVTKIRLPSTTENSGIIVIDMDVIFDIEGAHTMLYNNITMEPGGSYRIKAVTDTIPLVEQVQQ